MALLSAQRETDMTRGGITRHLVAFALPLLVGNIFQVLYNTVDSIVVGNFVGKEALAAVGSVASIINTLIGFFMGLASGAGVVISQYYGAHDNKNVHRAVHTTMLMTFLLCIVFTAVGVLLTPHMLRLMATPDDVFDGAALFLRIYFGGVSGLMIYNMGAGVLRAVGDSRRPLYFLVVSAVVNTVLDLLFVVGFRWGIAGTALATDIAQFLSAALVLLSLSHTTASYGLIWRNLHIDVPIMRKIWRIGLPSALQQAVTSFSNVFVQAYINGFGSASMAGWSSYTKIESFVILPMQSVALSATTFVGQNLGAGDVKRARAGTNRAITVSLVSTAALAIPIWIFARQLISLFNTDPDVVQYGTLFLHLLAPFYLACVLNQVYAGSLRGAGDTKVPMAIMLLSFVVFRQVYLYVTSRLIGSLVPVALGYPVGWVLCSLAMMVYYVRGGWEKRRVVVSRAQELERPAEDG